MQGQQLIPNPSSATQDNFDSSPGEALPRRGLFVSVIQNPPTLSSREEITKLIEFAKKAEIEVLFVQIYRSGKAWFPSGIADAAPYQVSLKQAGEDPFALLIKEAHVSGIQVHAWLNMLSLSTNQDAPLLKKYGTDILTRNRKEKKTLEDYKIDNQYFLEPGDLRVRQELSNMVEEILRAYPDLDGIQFDYIRYPDKNPAYGFTKINVARFKASTNLQTVDEESQAWKDWKRNQVTAFLNQLIQKTIAIRSDIQISTTGCMNYVRAYHEAFQDWAAWLNGGLIQFVTIMSYTKKTEDFEKYIAEAKSKTRDFKKVNIAIGAYEFLDSSKTFAKQFKLCEHSGGGACVVFHYGSLLENPALQDPLINGKKSKTE